VDEEALRAAAITGDTVARFLLADLVEDRGGDSFPVRENFLHHTESRPGHFDGLSFGPVEPDGNWRSRQAPCGCLRHWVATPLGMGQSTYHVCELHSRRCAGCGEIEYPTNHCQCEDR
jgi:hypothetical protein